MTTTTFGTLFSILTDKSFTMISMTIVSLFQRLKTMLLVWSTGDFLNPEEVLQPEYLQRFKESRRAIK